VSPENSSILCYAKSVWSLCGVEDIEQPIPSFNAALSN